MDVDAVAGSPDPIGIPGEVCRVCAWCGRFCYFGSSVSHRKLEAGVPPACYPCAAADPEASGVISDMTIVELSAWLGRRPPIEELERVVGMPITFLKEEP